MSLDDVIRRSDHPHTPASLTVDLRSLGVGAGDMVMLHVSLSSIGFIAGGAMGLLLAVLDALGPEGTLVMPAFSSDLIDPGLWREPGLPPDWIDPLSGSWPAYDPARTPTTGVGCVA